MAYTPRTTPAASAVGSETPDRWRLDLVELGGRAQGLIERIRETGGEIVIMARGRPVALLTPMGPAPEEPPQERVTWDIEGIAP